MQTPSIAFENLVLEVNACARLTRERCERLFEDDANIGS